jgi:hypothetical protein
MRLQVMLDKKPNISGQFEHVIGSSSPVQKCLVLVKSLIEEKPMPIAKTQTAQSASVLLGTHLLHLLGGAGMMNCAGYHSAAVTIFRPLEDALDCFGAVSLIEGQAERWFNNSLKASEAAKLWINCMKDIDRTYFSEYRRKLRAQFNDYSHCSPQQANWNLYFSPTTETKGTMELNTKPFVINSNAHRIDAHLTAHLYEFLWFLETAYEEYLNNNQELGTHLIEQKHNIKEILDNHEKHGCFEISVPAEIESIKYSSGG